MIINKHKKLCRTNLIAVHTHRHSNVCHCIPTYIKTFWIVIFQYLFKQCMTKTKTNTYITNHFIGSNFRPKPKRLTCLQFLMTLDLEKVFLLIFKKTISNQKNVWATWKIMSISLLTSFFDTLLYVLISINRAINFQAFLVLETHK